MEKAARKTYLDAIRILACIGVIYNHVIGPGVIGSAAQPSYLALFSYSLCKTAVPLFFMVTGTLLLARVDTYKKTLYRCLRIVIVLALFIGLNYAVHCLKTGERFDIGTFVLSVYRDRLGITYSYWYLYRYLSLLVMMPLLQRLAPRMTVRDMRYFLLLSVGVCGLALSVSFYAPWLRPNPWLSLPLFSIYIGMLIQGYYVDRHIENSGRYALLACAGVLLCNAIAAYTQYGMWEIDPARAWFLDRCDRTSVTLAAGCIFYIVKYLDGRVRLTQRAQRAISYVGRLTFPIYLVSELLIDNLSFVREWLAARMPAFGAERLYVLAVFAVGLGIAAVLTRIPLVRKLFL